MPDFIPVQRDQPPEHAGRGPPRGRLWSSLRCWCQAHGSVPPWFRAPVRRLGIGFLVAVLVTVLAVSLDSGLLPGAPSFGLASLATLLTVLLLALFWGAGPSLTATLMGTALFAWLIGARFSTRTGGRVALLDESIVLVVGLLLIACISWRGDERRRSPRVAERAEPQAADLAALLAEVQARAELERMRLEAIFASIADAVTVYDREGRIQHLNATALAFHGLEDVSTARSIPASERGMRLRLRDAAGDPLPPERWQVARLLNGENIASAEAEDILITNLRGCEMEVSVSGMPVREADGRIVGAVMVMRDVTERRRPNKPRFFTDLCKDR